MTNGEEKQKVPRGGKQEPKASELRAVPQLCYELLTPKGHGATRCSSEQPIPRHSDDLFRLRKRKQTTNPFEYLKSKRGKLNTREKGLETRFKPVAISVPGPEQGGPETQV